jgi:hypothetical protein
MFFTALAYVTVLADSKGKCRAVFERSKLRFLAFS